MWHGATMDVGQDGCLIRHRRGATVRREGQLHFGRTHCESFWAAAGETGWSWRRTGRLGGFWKTISRKLLLNLETKRGAPGSLRFEGEDFWKLAIEAQQ